jgi:hypothetical protein
MATLKETIQHLTSENLRDLARNEAAPKESRLAAVEILKQRKSKHVNHPELIDLSREHFLRLNPEECPPGEPDPDSAIKPEPEEVVDEDRSAEELLLQDLFQDGPGMENEPEPELEPEAGPLKASVTTETLQKDEADPEE